MEHAWKNLQKVIQKGSKHEEKNIQNSMRKKYRFLGPKMSSKSMPKSLTGDSRRPGGQQEATETAIWSWKINQKDVPENVFKKQKKNHHGVIDPKMPYTTKKQY